MKGLVFNIKKYALHDGPGIRTTVFFKGCPLSCKWCHNPESIDTVPELIFYNEKCIQCGCCEDFTKAEPCPTLALEQVGTYYSVEDLIQAIKKDVVFYDQSHGGVTFSGGEPLMQSEFLLAVLKACKKEGLHTVLDTCGFATWEKLEAVQPYVDLFLFDIKHLDPIAHEAMTGVSNDLILENLNRLLEKSKVQLRLPVIKDYNDDITMMEAVLAIAKHENVVQVNFLPYHNFAENKYNHLKVKKVFEAFERPDSSWLEDMVRLFESNGVKAQIGG